MCCLVLRVLGECVCVWSPTMSGAKGAGPAWCTQSGVCAHWEACGDQRRNYRGPPKKSICPVATPRHKSQYIFTRLVHQHFWPVKEEQYMALAEAPGRASLPYTGPDLLSIDQSNRYICLASQGTQRMETHFCLALANQEAHFCLALLSIAPHFA